MLKMFKRQGVYKDYIVLNRYQYNVYSYCKKKDYTNYRSLVV